jgi:hypothetical protein
METQAAIEAMDRAIEDEEGTRRVIYDLLFSPPLIDHRPRVAFTWSIAFCQFTMRVGSSYLALIAPSMVFWLSPQNS